MPPGFISFYSQANETNAQLFADSAGLEGMSLGFIAYGVHATLYLTCLTLFWQERNRKDTSRACPWPWFMYTTVLFIIGSINTGLNMSSFKIAYLDNRNYPSGPAAFATQNLSLPNLVSAACSVVGSWLADGLLIIRFYIIVSPKWWIMILPCGLYSTSIVFSIALLHEFGFPGSVPWIRKNGMNPAVIYWSTSVTINAILTGAIVVMLLRMRRTVRQVMGPNHKVPYMSISAMLVESAFLYTAFVLASLVPLAMGSSVSLIFFDALEQVQLIAPLLIMSRVAKGRAFTRQRLEESIRMTGVTGIGSLQFNESAFGTVSASEIGLSTAPTSETTLALTDRGSPFVPTREETRKVTAARDAEAMPSLVAGL